MIQPYLDRVTAVVIRTPANGVDDLVQRQYVIGEAAFAHRIKEWPEERIREAEEVLDISAPVKESDDGNE